MGLHHHVELRGSRAGSGEEQTGPQSLVATLPHVAGFCSLCGFACDQISETGRAAEAVLGYIQPAKWTQLTLFNVFLSILTACAKFTPLLPVTAAPPAGLRPVSPSATGSQRATGTFQRVCELCDSL